MARISLQPIALGQVTATTGGAKLSTLLSLDETDDSVCQYPELILQADRGNGSDVFIGGVDAAGAIDISATKCIKLGAETGIVLGAEDAYGDEDFIVYDLRKITLMSAIADQKLNIAAVKVTRVSYNG